MNRADSVGIEINGLRKLFTSKREQVVAIDNLSLTVGRGEAVALLGPSGCGKTTTLRCVAGLEKPDSGRITIEGTDVVDIRPSQRRIIVPPERREIGMVFQSYALWPHMTVRENVSYPLRVASKEDKSSIARRVDSTLSKVGCLPFANRYPGQLSGGQQQRVSLARALIRNATTVLFDEPLSNLDAKLRDELRFELSALQRELGFSALYVTHDQAEAMAIASTIAIMFRGQIHQLGTPTEVYESPATREVAAFLGSPQFIEGLVTSQESEPPPFLTVATALGNVRGRVVGTLPKDQRVVSVCLRSERIRVLTQDEGGAQRETDNSWVGAVTNLTYLGAKLALLVAVGKTTLRAEIPIAEGRSGIRLQRGDQVRVSVDAQDTLIFQAPAADEAEQSAMPAIVRAIESGVGANVQQ